MMLSIHGLIRAVLFSIWYCRLLLGGKKTSSLKHLLHGEAEIHDLMNLSQHPEIISAKRKENKIQIEHFPYIPLALSVNFVYCCGEKYI